MKTIKLKKFRNSARKLLVKKLKSSKVVKRRNSILSTMSNIQRKSLKRRNKWFQTQESQIYTTGKLGLISVVSELFASSVTQCFYHYG
jgi:hypothetical protein